MHILVDLHVSNIQYCRTENIESVESVNANSFHKGANVSSRISNPNFFSKNCMKIKKIGPTLNPPMHSGGYHPKVYRKHNTQEWYLQQTVVDKSCRCFRCVILECFVYFRYEYRCVEPELARQVYEVGRRNEPEAFLRNLQWKQEHHIDHPISLV